MGLVNLLIIGIPSLSAILATGLALASWRRRPARGAAFFSLTLASIALWSLGDVLELISTELTTKLFWASFQYFGMVLLPAAWLKFSYQYANVGGWRSRRAYFLLSISPLVTLALVWTNSQHGLIWQDAVIRELANYNVLDFSFGPGYWAFVVYSYVLVAIGYGVIIRVLLQSSPGSYSQIGALLFAAIPPVATNFLFLSNLTPIEYLDPTPMGFVIASVVMYWALYRQGFLDLSPVVATSLIYNMVDGVIVLDSEKRIIDINPAMKKILRLRGNKSIGSGVRKVFAEWSTGAEFLYEQTESQIELYLEREDDRHYFDLRISPLPLQQGENTGAVAVFRDVSKRVKAEQALREGENRYQLLVESSPEAICVHVDGKYVYFNPAGLKLFNATREDQIVGKPILEFVHPDDRVHVKKRLKKLYDESLSIGPVEEMMITVDGQTIEVEIVAEPIIYQGKPAVQAIIRDVSLRIRAEENYKRLIENSPEAIAVHAEGKFIYINPAFQNLYAASDADQIIGKEVLDFLSPEYREQVLERLKMIKQGIEWTGNNEGKIVRLDGKTIDVEASADQISFQGKDAIQIVMRDITARKLEETRLERQVEELVVLHTVAAAAAQAASVDELIKETTMIVGSALFLSNFGFLLIDDGSQSLILHNSYRFENNQPEIDVPAIPLGEGITGKVARTGEAIRVGDVGADPNYLKYQSGINSELCVPIKSGQKVLGVINSESEALNAFSEADERLLQIIAGQIAVGIEKVRYFEEVQRLAITDSLTGLNNRRYFFELARKEFERARRFGHPLVAIMLDFDKFKSINEKFGHAGGDQALAEVAGIWEQELRDVDVIGRYGGDEFAILLPEADLAAGKKVAQRLCKKVNALRVDTERGQLSLTASIGVAALLESSPNIEKLIDRADRGMYLSKNAGGNSVNSVND